MGDAKGQFSDGKPGDETNNVYLATAFLIWVGAKVGDPDWLGECLGDFRRSLEVLALYRNVFCRHGKVLA